MNNLIIITYLLIPMMSSSQEENDTSASTNSSIHSDQQLIPAIHQFILQTNGEYHPSSISSVDLEV